MKAIVWFWICVLMLGTSSCSKSLTDYGYRGGPTTTNQSYYGQPWGGTVARINNRDYPKLGPDAYYNDPSRGYYGYTLDGEPLKKTYKLQMAFLLSFYHRLLSDNWDATRLSKKYLRHCSPEVVAAIKRFAEMHPENEPKEWGALITETSRKDNQGYFIHYFGSDWFNVRLKTAEPVDLKLRLQRKKNKTIITGFENPYYGILLE